MTSSDVQPTGRPQRRMRQTVGDMVRSMAVVMVVVVFIMLLSWRPQPEAIKVVDVVPVVSLAAAQATFPVTAPRDLPESWRPTSVRWERTADSGDDPVLHIGYVTPSDMYAQVGESARTDERFLDEQTDSGVPIGSTTIAGQEWEKRERGERRSLVLAAEGSVTIVSGTSSWDELVGLVASLDAVATPTAA